MRNLFLLTSILFLFSFARCNKDRLDSNGLPPATQSGKNTLGFLLNGQPWTPRGNSLTANLSIDFDPGYNDGIFGIVAYNFITPSNEQFTIAVRDSLNFIQAPVTLYLNNNNSLYGVSFNKPCYYFSSYSDVQSTGSLTLTKFDKTNHIISGTFNATLWRSGCDTIRITEGRFDMRY